MALHGFVRVTNFENAKHAVLADRKQILTVVGKLHALDWLGMCLYFVDFLHWAVGVLEPYLDRARARRLSDTSQDASCGGYNLNLAEDRWQHWRQ